jgi:hypothetical protein
MLTNSTSNVSFLLVKMLVTADPPTPSARPGYPPAIKFLGKLSLPVDALETAIHSLPAHRPALSQGLEEYDVPDPS